MRRARSEGAGQAGSADSERQLVARAREGEASAFEQIVAAHAGSVYRTVVGMCGQRDAEDLVQETFLRVHQGLSRFEGRSSLRTWILGIASNLSLKRIRSQQRWSWLGRLGEQQPQASFADPAMQVQASEQQRAIASALEQLPVHQRAVVALRIYERLSFQEIGQVLGIPRPTAESRMARARTRLEALLAPWLKEADL